MQQQEDIDEKEYNAHEHFLNFIKDKGLESLIKKNNELFGEEIKTLDSEMQTLVYENYNKFISATDTIKKIKKKIDNMDDELICLKESLTKINSSYSAVDEKMKYKWKEVQRLSKIEENLDKLRQLSGLPEELKSAIDKYQENPINIDIFNQPINIYFKYNHILMQYKHTPFLVNIFSEITNSINKIKTILRKLLEKNKQEKNEELTIKSIKLLVQLEDEKTDLRNVYVQIKQDILMRKLKEIKNSVPRPAKEIDLSTYEQIFEEREYITEDEYDIVENTREKSKTVILDNVKFNKNDINDRFNKQKIDLHSLKSKTLKKGTILWFIKKYSESIIPLFIDSIKEYKDLFCYNTVEQDYIKDPKDKNSVALVDFVKAFFVQYNNEIKDKLKQSYLQIEFLKECLFIIHEDTKNISSIIGFRNDLVDKASEIAEFTIRRQIDLSMKQLYSKIRDSLIDLRRKCMDWKEESKMQDIVEQVYHQIMYQICVTLVDSKPLIKHQEHFLRSNIMFISLVHAQILECFKILEKLILTGLIDQVSTDDHERYIVELQESMHGHKISGKYIIALIQLCLTIENTGTLKLLNIVHDLFHQELVLSGSGEDDSMKMQENEKQVQGLWEKFEKSHLPEILSSFKELMKCLIKKYTDFYARQIYDILNDYFDETHWSEFEEPKAISAEILYIFEKLLESDQEMNILFGAKHNTFKNIVLTIKSKTKQFIKVKKKNTMDVQMERFYAKKQETFQKLEFKRHSIMLTLIKLVLKAFYELVRLNRFNEYGFQQIQADCCFLSICCEVMIPNEETGVIPGLFSEIMSNCISRCLNIHSIDETVLEGMVQFKLQKYSDVLYKNV